MPSEKLTITDFTESVEPLINVLKDKVGNNLCVSDIRDVLDKQYVDLVQEGGGIHGIALAGYTYVLEKMNIGFMKMAGTSAGSINTLLLNAVLTKKEAEALKKEKKLLKECNYYETRSEKVLEYLADKELSDIVDGHPLWRKLLLTLFSHATGDAYIKKQFSFLKMAALSGVFSFLILLIGAIFLIFHTTQNTLHAIFQWTTLASAVLLIIVLSVFFSRLILIRLLYRYAEKFGINPGKDFEDWLTKILRENGIATVEDLETKIKYEKEVLNPQYKSCRRVNGLEDDNINHNSILPETLLERIKNPDVNAKVLFDDLNQVLDPDLNSKSTSKKQELQVIMNAFEERLAKDPVVTREIIIVSSDITHGIKVEFPGMHKMYWGNDYGISPAKYVHASMAVPLFFKPLQINFNPSQHYVIQQEWLKFTKTPKTIENCALFVDGGLLSNFPINVFYNSAMPVPRKPTFGIKLEYEDEWDSKKIQSLMQFGGSLVNTMRYFYDRDFSLKHDTYQKTVRSIDTGKIHWLNFNLSNREKIELFYRGALAATLFLAKHKMTEAEVQHLINLGRDVKFKPENFSIYSDEEVIFRTEDCLIGNVTFEWQEYKKERLMDCILKDARKLEMKEEAALKTVPSKSASDNKETASDNKEMPVAEIKEKVPSGV